MSNKNRTKNYPDVDEDDENFDLPDFDNEDREYTDMLPNSKSASKNSYFMKSEKYRGTTNPKIQQSEQQENSQRGEQSKQNQDGLKIAIKQMKQSRKKKSKLLEENMNIIDQADQQELNQIKKDEQQYGNPQKLKNYLSSFRKMVEVRVYSQKNIEQIKKYPVRNYQYSPECNDLMKQAEETVYEGLGNLIHNYQTIASEIFGDNIGQAEILPTLSEVSSSDQYSNQRLNIEGLWKKFTESTKQMNQKLEQGIIDWSQKTVLLRNSTNRSQYNSLLMQTPIGQAKKGLDDWERVCKKSQLKRSPFRIFLEGQDNLLANSNPNIYDDLDLIQDFHKIYEQNIDKQDKQFLISETMKYIENRNENKVKKDVDRKASKNRKIRYNVHAKLLNFMPCSNQNLLEARDQIIRNLFNRGPAPESQSNQEEIQYIDI